MEEMKNDVDLESELLNLKKRLLPLPSAWIPLPKDKREFEIDCKLYGFSEIDRFECQYKLKEDADSVVYNLSSSVSSYYTMGLAYDFCSYRKGLTIGCIFHNSKCIMLPLRKGSKEQALLSEILIRFLIWGVRD